MLLNPAVLYRASETYITTQTRQAFQCTLQHIFVFSSDHTVVDARTLQMVINLRPARPESGEFSRLTSVHGSEDCLCDIAPVEELAVNRYLMSLADYRARARRYSAVRK